MTETYMIVVSDADDSDNLYAYAFGDLATISFVTRKALKDIKDVTGDVEFKIGEVSAIGDTTINRSVVSVTGDVDVVTFIAKKKLAKERKDKNVDEDESAEKTAA